MAILSRPRGVAASAGSEPARGWVGPALAIGLVLLLRIPTLFEPPYYGDEGVFAATAARMLDGASLYAEAWDNKPPLVYLLYAGVLGLLGPSALALRAVGVLLAAATALAVLGIARRVAGPRAALWAVAVFAVLGSTPLVEGTLLLTEAVAALPAAVGMLFVLVATEREGRARDRRLALAGACFGLACCAKQVAALDAAAAGVWLLLRAGRPWRDIAWLAGGWLVPVALTALWLAAIGAGGDGWSAVVWGYRGYLGERLPLPHWFTPLAYAPPLLAVCWALRSRRRANCRGSDLALLWFGFALLAVLMPGRPFGHYIVQATAPAAVLVAVALSGRRAGSRVATVALAGGTYLLVMQFWPFWFGTGTVRPDYYGNWLAYISGRRDRAAYERFLDWRVANQEEIVRLVRADGGERTLFVWGEYPWAYALADARNSTRFATSYQTFLADGAKREAIGDLERAPPRFIAEEMDDWRRLPGLTELLAVRYEPVARIDNTVLWRRKP